MDIKEYACSYAGLLVIGDIHGDIESFMRAINYAEKNTLFLVLLGDLVDQGPFPFETLSEALNLLENGSAVFVRGNHDNKHYRNAKGNSVRFSNDARRTIQDVGADRLNDYLSRYVTLYEHPKSDYYHYIDNWTFAHGGTHHSLWDRAGQISSKAKSMALYGEVTGESDDDGLPARIYTWVDSIPDGQCVIVGHDRKAIHNVTLKEPLVISSTVTNGVAIFADTGCGKGGILSGVVLKFTDDKKLVLDKFKKFNEEEGAL